MFLLSQQAPFANSNNYFQIFYNFDDVVDKVAEYALIEDRENIIKSLKEDGEYELEQEEGLPEEYSFIVKEIPYQQTTFVLAKTYFGEYPSSHKVFGSKMDAIKFVLDNDISEIYRYSKRFPDLTREELECVVKNDLINDNGFCCGLIDYTIKKFVDDKS